MFKSLTNLVVTSQIILKLREIAFRENDRTIITSAQPRKGTKFIDHLPSPSIESMPLQTYADLGIPHWGLPVAGKKFSSIQTARGCRDKCTFLSYFLEKRERFSW